MVRLTLDLIARGTSGYTKKKRDEGMHHYLRRLTHLYLEDRAIDEIGDDLGSCKNLNVLYLYDNKLTRVPNLYQNASLTHLYLQNNQICKIEGFSGLRKLTKLYIGGNHITVLEGLDQLDQLQELHVENQKLPPGEKLLFDPRSLSSIANSLQVCNISGNNLDSISDLNMLRHLTQFVANDNHLNDMKEMAHMMSSCRSLWRLELAGNPICHKAKYRDRIIVMAPSLEVLDGKEITETARQFLKNWQANKEAIKRRKDFMSRETSGVSRNVGEGDEVPVQQVSSIAPGYIMPGLPRKQFQEVLARSTSLPSSAMHPPSNRTYSDITAAKGYGTVYHQQSGTNAPYRLALVDMFNNLPPVESRSYTNPTT